jgi:hypothetical protein
MLSSPIHGPAGTRLLDANNKIAQKSLTDYANAIISLTEKGYRSSRLSSVLGVPIPGAPFFEAGQALSEQEKERILDPEGRFQTVLLGPILQSLTDSCNVNGQLLLFPAFDPLSVAPNLSLQDIPGFTLDLTLAISLPAPAATIKFEELSKKYNLSLPDLLQFVGSIVSLAVPPPLPQLPIPVFPSLPAPELPFSVVPDIFKELPKLPLSILDLGSITYLVSGLLPVPTPPDICKTIFQLLSLPFIALVNTLGLGGNPCAFQTAYLTFLLEYSIALAASTAIAICIGSGPISRAVVETLVSGAS